jgi:hypothetical protein
VASREGSRSAYVRAQIGVLSQAIAGPLDLYDDGVVEEPIEKGSCDNGIAEHLSPLGEATVRGEDHGALLIAGIDELEEEVGAAGSNGEISNFVDNEQRGSAEASNTLAQLALSLGFGEGGERGEVHTATRFDGLHRKCGR